MAGQNKCDFCDEQAKYDGKTIMGPWAFMCQAHMDRYGVGLGLGKGHVILTQQPESEQRKVCVQCGENKLLTDYYTDGEYKGKKRHRPECKECYRFNRLQNAMAKFHRKGAKDAKGD